MGRNLPSASELIFQTIGELRHVGEMLPLQDRITLDRFAEFALNHRAAIAHAASLQPLEIMLLLLLVEQHKTLERIEHELRTEIERLKADLL